MSIEQTNVNVSTDEMEINERDYWKEQANIRGVSYANNITTAKLKELVQARIAEQEAANSGGTRGRQSLEKLAPEVLANIDKATALVRFQINVLDPSKQDWTAITVTAGNANFSPIRRVIPLNAPVWHAERILVEVLKTMKYAHRKSERHPRLRQHIDNMSKPKYLPCFSIVELPPLTEEELKALAEQQAVNNTGQSEND
jgi:hypothetical protein